MPSPPRDHVTAGILWMLATMLCFIALDTVMKHLLQNYSVVQVSWARFFFATAVAALACGRRLPRLIHSQTPGLQLMRSGLLTLTTGAFNLGIRSVPLATGTTIMFLSPVLITVLSIPLLGEKIGIRRLAGVALGFFGALIVVRPWQEGFGGLGTGVLFLLAAALLNANYQIVTRKVRSDDPLTSLLYTALVGAVLLSVFLPWFWTAPAPLDWLLFIVSGALGGLGHLCLIRALQLAPASVVAPFSYSSLVWAALAGFLFFNEWPDIWTFAGAALIMASGLYIFHRERQLAKPGQDAA